jgi:hypothetical protein
MKLYGKNQYGGITMMNENTNNVIDVLMGLANEAAAKVERDAKERNIEFTHDDYVECMDEAQRVFNELFKGLL